MPTFNSYVIVYRTKNSLKFQEIKDCFPVIWKEWKVYTLRVTIQDVADRAGVSIATVSHILNKTRYVRPELVERVEKAILETGYEVKGNAGTNDLILGKKSKIAFVIPDLNGTIFNQFVNHVNHLLREYGYTLVVFITDETIETERAILQSLLADKNIAGIFLIPCARKDKVYQKVKKSRKPFVCIERGIDDPDIACVLANNEHAIYLGTRHLIRCGHNQIGILLGKMEVTTREERLNGYIRALKENGLEVNPINIRYVDTEDTSRENIFAGFPAHQFPSAFIASGNTLTHVLLHDIDAWGLSCPQDISVVGFGDDTWSDLFAPPLTILTQQIEKMSRKAVEILLCQIQGVPFEQPIERIPIDFRVRKSTRVINRGPFGESAVSVEELILTEQEALQLRQNRYKVALAFHNTNTYWSSLQEKAIRDTLGKYNVQVISVMDANFDPQLQIAQLDALQLQKPDAIIGISVDENITADKFKIVSKTTKMILIGNLPQGFNADDYYCCVSVNERENGQNAGVVLGEYFKQREHVNIGMLIYGVPFQMTQQRDESAEQVIRENYPNLHIVTKKKFFQIEDAYRACREMLTEHPEIEGMYISWERPALEAIRALEEMDRMDISISTVDLDMKVASYMAKGKLIRGISAQRPYEQGQAAALVTMQALLGKTGYKYVGVQPVRVFPYELPKVWREIMKTPIPEELYRDDALQF